MLDERSVGAIVFRKGKRLEFLLLQYEGGYWDFVKGKREKGERSRETLLRELKEETSLEDAKLLNDFKERITYIYKLGSERVLKEVVFYLTRVKAREVKISHEHIDFGWYEYEEALKKLTYKNTRDVLKKAYQFIVDREEEILK
ncbi:MAG: Diadenosine hexaphosphate hydrolase [candidate division WS2 bacterium]|uniref:Bis(5'-nucleosyl)-tetraphosphatase [asymmetrical] n=1 Tax=Psychracetigena formicireducens TaxID=2986056 RepID=A0A9E2F164_PSYF1|nr:Diadenosine hexaphosphate hydrolase [Candidatus Psychracetigena formicireducens]MBT9145124.1 Diadenosine hexaphosphate hydrolase [Candidatus Psychracetigena formicireducens]MBT9150376.1 Diadenosine hexaphosphate hydrolase [Candidatus Psychracetigena formicireducens]